LSGLVVVSIHKHSDEERRQAQRRRPFFAGPQDYIKESLEYLRAVARCLEMGEPSLFSIGHSLDMVILHWLSHDDVRVWRAPAEKAGIGLVTTFFPEILRIELVHLYDEDTTRKFSYCSELGASPLSAIMQDSLAAEWQQMWGGSDCEVAQSVPDARFSASAAS
jgi:hypothetical protein